MTKILGRSQILAIQDLERELVDVPEWGGAVYVRSLSGAERDELIGSMVVSTNGSVDVPFSNLVGIRERLAAMTIVDDGGENLFTLDDVAALGKKNSSALQRIFDVAMRLSGLSQEEIEGLEKNSESAPKGASGSV